MESPRWYLRRHTPLASIALVFIGTWTAVALLPTVFLSLSIFIIFGGPGIFIALKQKNLHTLGVLMLFPAWFYLFTMLLFARGYYRLFYDLAVAIVFLVASGISVLVWAVLKKRSPNNKTLTNAKKPLLLASLFLLVLVPFVIGISHDYNMRADTSQPELTNARIVAKFFFTDDDGEHTPFMTFETLEESLHFDYPVSWDYYDHYNVGDSGVIWLRRGALGYPWITGYVG